MSESMITTVPTPIGDVKVRRATAAEVVDLRHRVLRAGLPRETAIFPGDEHADAIHVAAEDSEGKIVGCATIHPSTWEGQPAWQLRGMATDPAVRGSGVGSAMLAMIVDLARARGPQLLWCNARVPAIDFYKRVGWEIVSERFEIPTAGPHVKMLLPLPGTPGRGQGRGASRNSKR